MASPHVARYGNEEQLDRWMPGIVTGEVLTAVAVTEPDAGSDVAGVKTRATRKGDNSIGATSCIATRPSRTAALPGALHLRLTPVKAPRGGFQSVRQVNQPRDRPGSRLQRRAAGSEWTWTSCAEWRVRMSMARCSSSAAQVRTQSNNPSWSMWRWISSAW